MTKVRFDLSCHEVTLDLNQLKLVLGIAVRLAREELNNIEFSILNSLEQAAKAEHERNSREHYRQLSRANTARDWLVEAAQQYADIIQAYFHASEALKREQVIVIREEQKWQ